MKSGHKIKILFRHRSMEMGGVEKVLLSIINNLDREKFDITVCLNLNQGELRDEFPTDIRKVILSKGREDMSSNPIVQKLQLFKRRIKLYVIQLMPKIVDEKILKEKYDIEVAMTYNDFEMVLNSTNKDSKKVGWFHSEINIKGFEVLVPKIISQFPQFDRMVYCSQKIKDLMHIHHPNIKYPFENVIFNAIPTEEIRKKSIEKVEYSSNVPTFISVGRLHSRKGYHQLLEVHKRLIQDGFAHKIIILGDGEEKENLKLQIENSKVQESFLLYGNKMNPYKYINRADFFILPSMSEAWPLVVAESLLLRKPTIGTETGDIPKMIKHEETGLVVKYDSDEIYNAMKRFLTDNKLIERINFNLLSIDEQFDNKKIFQSIEDMFLETLEK